MADSTKPEPFTLSRWSRRKLEASRASEDTSEAPPPAEVRPPLRDNPNAPAANVAATSTAPTAAPDLPPVDSLTIDSDFTPFLKPEVDEGTRRAALRKLFRDPRFNVMDGLDVYIDDYGKTVPIPDDVLAKLAHARYILDPPKTRLNAQGYVEDVVEEAAPRPGEAQTGAPEVTDDKRASTAPAEGECAPPLATAVPLPAPEPRPLDPARPKA